MPFDFSFIEAEIGTETEIKGICNKSTWRYIFTFDDAQLISGAVLSGTSISGIFCQGCFTDWIQQIVGNEPYIVTEDGGNQVFVSPHGCEYPIATGIALVSEDEGNMITFHEDGIYVCPLAIEDTETVDLTLTNDGNECYTLSADVILSENADNQLSAEADGLYVPEPPAQELLGVDDTATVDLTIDGTIPQTLSADVKISATGGNIITAEADGIYATTSGGGDYTSLFVDTTRVVLNSGAGVLPMLSYTIPGGTLAINHDKIIFKGYGTCVADPGSVNGIVSLDGTTIFSSSFSGIFEPDYYSWEINGSIVRVDATTVKCSTIITAYYTASSRGYSAFPGAVYIQLTKTLANPLVLLFSGNPFTGEIVQEALFVDKINAP